jgi:hypothetical protein
VSDGYQAVTSRNALRRTTPRQGEANEFKEKP